MRGVMIVNVPIKVIELVAGEDVGADALRAGDADATDAIDAEQEHEKYAKHVLMFITQMKMETF